MEKGKDGKGEERREKEEAEWRLAGRAQAETTRRRQSHAVSSLAGVSCPSLRTRFTRSTSDRFRKLLTHGRAEGTGNRGTV